MAWYPGARRVGVPGMTTSGTRTRTDAAILHVADGEATSLAGWWNSPASGSAGSHFHVARSGAVEQYADTSLITWTSGAGSRRSVGIETQGRAAGPWTAAQVSALVALLDWLCRVHGIPRRAMTSSALTQRGIGWHRLGVPATQAQRAAGRSMTGGELWSSAVGKVCPGPDRIAQIPGIVARVAAAVATVSNPQGGTGGAGLPAGPGGGITDPALTPTLEDSMLLITAPGRGTALVGPGYVQVLDTEEARRVWRAMPGVREHVGNAREFDVIRHGAVAGRPTGLTAGEVAAVVRDVVAGLPGGVDAADVAAAVVQGIGARLAS